MILREAPREDLAWLAEHARIDVDATLKAIEVTSDTGRILGMVGFNGWARNSCLMHVALDHPSAGRYLIRPAFHFVFEIANRGVAVGTLRSDNEKALRLNRHLGFREVLRGRDWFEVGVDQVWMEMRKEECRWLTGAARKAA